MTGDQLIKIYDLLYSRYGRQYWWPGETPFEIIVGAILTQNTAWINVEKAIVNLKQRQFLAPEHLHRLSQEELAELIKPAGYFRVKAKRLKNFTNWLFEQYQGNLDLIKDINTYSLREQLLGISGIGPETADSILLYAFERPVFVIDTYTARITVRHGLIEQADADYQQLQDLFTRNLPQDTQLYNEFHALLVRIGKEFCKPKAKCENCPLNVLPHQIE